VLQGVSRGAVQAGEVLVLHEQRYFHLDLRPVHHGSLRGRLLPAAPPLRRLSAVARRLSAVARRLSAVARRLSAVARRLSAAARRLSAVARRLSAVARRLSAVARRMSAVARQVLRRRRPAGRRRKEPPRRVDTRTGVRNPIDNRKRKRHERAGASAGLRKADARVPLVRDLRAAVDCFLGHQRSAVLHHRLL